jgi:hypothetical protein
MIQPLCRFCVSNTATWLVRDCKQWTYLSFKERLLVNSKFECKFYQESMEKILEAKGW